MKERRRRPDANGTPRNSNTNHKLWIVIGLVVLNILIYAQVLNFDFVDFDDGGYVFGNPVVRAGVTWHGLWWALTTRDESNWHPLTWLSHMLDAQLFGMNAAGHHATSVLLHMLNS